MRKSKIILSLILVVVIIYAGYFLSDVFSADKNKSANFELFKINKEDNFSQVAENLYDEGFIHSPANFKMYFYLFHKNRALKPGDYLLQKSMSLREVGNMLAYGQISREREIKIIEGWTITQIDDYLAGEGIITAGEFKTEATNAAKYKEKYATEYPFLKNVWGKTLEGFLFPDTYRVYIDSTSEEIVVKMLDNFAAKTTTIMPELKKQDKNLYEIITLASVVEKEVNTPVDRRLVADIFSRRLSIGMPLQSDATVNYVTGKGALQPSADDISVASPYNTYTHRGLPPGPICSPGLDSIEAVVGPKANDYWYFLTTPDEQVIYSRTYSEHIANKQKYLE